MKANFEIGQTVYHREIYNHKEPLKIVGIRENELELEGDYSGGTNPDIIGKSWLPIKGVSRIYNAQYKQECRDAAVCIQELAKPIVESKDNMTRAMFDLLHMVFVLTTDISYNPEY